MQQEFGSRTSCQRHLRYSHTGKEATALDCLGVGACGPQDICWAVRIGYCVRQCTSQQHMSVLAFDTLALETLLHRDGLACCSYKGTVL